MSRAASEHLFFYFKILFQPGGNDYISSCPHFRDTCFPQLFQAALPPAHSHWCQISSSYLSRQKDSGKYSRVYQSQKRQLEVLFGTFLRFAFPLHDIIIPKKRNFYQDPLMAVLVHMCDIRAIAIQALVGQDGYIPRELHLFIFGYCQW